MVQVDLSGGPLGEFFATEWPTWEQYGRSGEAFFPDVGRAPSGATYRDPGLWAGIFGPQYWPEGLGGPPEPEIGPGGAARATLAERLRAEEASKLAFGAAERAADAGAAAAQTAIDMTLATIDYVSDIPGEIGEAGGEFLAGLADPLVKLPGDLLEGIPIWVPLLGAAFLFTR